jgi:hypothetical protein
MSKAMWNNGAPVSELGVDVPRWISQDISPADVAAICQGGCASGAYMPAVTYYDAAQTMAEHGDDVLQYIEDQAGEIPDVPKDSSWGGIACHFLSYAVELWASGIEDEVESLCEPEEAEA